MLLNDLLLEALDPLTFARQNLDFEPDPWQAKVLRSTSSQIILNCCRQSGKSTIAAICALHRATYFPNSLILLVSPSQRQSSELFRKITELRRKISFEQKLIEDNRRSLQFQNGSRIVSLPGDAERIRGFSGPSLIIVDEAAAVIDEIFVTIRPMLAVSGGTLMYLSTPLGKRGVFYKTWANQDTSWEKVKVTADQVPRIPNEFLSQERIEIGLQKFQQEFFCEFLDTSQSAFVFDDICQALDDDYDPLFITNSSNALDLNPNYRSMMMNGTIREVVLGVDLGKSKDFSTIAVLLKFPKGPKVKTIVTYLERFQLGTDYLDIVKRISCIHQKIRKYAKCRIVVDRTGLGEVVFEILHKQGLNPVGIIITGGKEPSGTPGGSWKVPKANLFNIAAADFKLARIKIAKSEPLALDLVHELSKLELRITDHGNVIYSTSEGGTHDDLALAFLIAHWYAEKGDFLSMRFLSL